MEVIHYQAEDGNDVYQEWVDGLRDARARVAILRRVDRAVTGNFGDHKACRDGVSEMRIDHGPGYRVYLSRQGPVLVLLLCGSDKGEQDKAIKLALAYLADWKQRGET